MTKQLAGNAGGKQISIKGGVWRMIVGGEEVAKNEDRAMNFVVLGHNPHINRTYYSANFEEGKPTDPTCWSADGLTPDVEVPSESRQSRTCATCTQNIAGSGAGESRACRYSKRLAVALENDIEGNVYRLQLPAKSLFGKPNGDKMPLQAYAKFLAGHGVAMTGVVTEARFDTSAAVPVLTFRAVRPLSRDEWNSAKEASQSEVEARAVEFKITPKAKRDAGPQASPYMDDTPAAPVFAAPETHADDEPVGEPVKRASKKVATVPPTGKQSAADVLSAWGDDDDN
jgi:hypothetical protein